VVSKYCCDTIPITFSRVLNSSPGCLYLHGPGFESPAHIETRVEGAWSLRLELKCDDLLSSFAFNMKLRPSSEVVYGGMDQVASLANYVVGRCRLTLRHPR